MPRDKASIATDLFAAITLKFESRQIAAYLKEALIVSRRLCERVADYQVFLEQPNRVVIKAKCPGRPIFGITVANNGFLSVYGGDGMLASFSVTDGPVVTLQSEEVVVAEYQTDQPREAEKEPQAVPMPARPPISPWIIASLAINIFVIGALLIGVFFIWKWIGTKQEKPVKAPRNSRFSSSDKDDLLTESKEILPDIFQHPDGVFIVRGRHGKRRIFPIIITAILYRDYGVKLFEVR